MNNVDHFPDGISEIIEHCKSMVFVYGTNGWPAIRMGTVTALCDEVERLKSLNGAYVQTLSNATTIYQQMLEALERIIEIEDGPGMDAMNEAREIVKKVRGEA